MTGGSPDSGLGTGDGSASDGAADKPYTLDDVCERTAPLICDLRKPCCTTSGPGYDEAGCIANAKAECAKDVAEVRAGRATFHGDRIPGCLPKYKEIFSAAGCVLTFDLLQKHIRDIGACEAFEGQLAEGATCEKTNDCKPGDTKDIVAGCDSDDEAKVGPKKCKYTTIVAENGGCALDNGLQAICDDGLYCDVTFGDAGAKGTCKKKTAIGASCDPNKKPLPLECGLGNYCDPATSKCMVGKKGGESCSNDLECGSVKCEKLADAGAGLCKALGSLVDKPEECKGP